MKNIALFIDYTLFSLVALTAALILYKGLELWAPRWVFKPDLNTRVGTDKDKLEEAMESLEAGVPLLAIVASAGPFIGLAGTVMHIMEALRAMAGAGVDITVISGPIATALNSTLVGLASAVPAAIAYNLMQRKLQLMHNRKLREFK